jgi:hypothetical protein
MSFKVHVIQEFLFQKSTSYYYKSNEVGLSSNKRTNIILTLLNETAETN